MSKHTAGPWKVCPDEKEYRNASLIVWGPQGPGYGTIAEATKYQYEAEANARLIAAAPEMLEALETVIKSYMITDTWGDDDDTPCFETASSFIQRDKALNKAITIVAKAKGES